MRRTTLAFAVFASALCLAPSLRAQGAVAPGDVEATVRLSTPTHAPLSPNADSVPRTDDASLRRAFAAETEQRWYGGESLIVEGLGVSAYFLGGSVEALGGPVALGGVAAFALGGPVIHAAHGRWGIASASLGLRLGLMTLGFAISEGTGSCDRRDENLLGCHPNAGVGLLGGLVAAVVIDELFLPYERVEASAKGVPATGVSLMPWLDRGRLGLAVQGSF